MNRRNLLQYLGLLGVGQIAAFPAATASAAAAESSAQKGIVLYCDLAIDPAREQEMLDHYHNDFKPAAEKFPGYIDLKMLKIRKLMQGGPAPEKGVNYRFQLAFESEEARQKWIASPTHKRLWPLIDRTVLNRDYLVLLTDIM
jgi:antibiotic biosynthesis monooxygenase (ABM) superfamily enzyme